MAPQPRSAKVHLHGSAAACSWGADTHWVISWIVATPASSLVQKTKRKDDRSGQASPSTKLRAVRHPAAESGCGWESHDPQAVVGGHGLPSVARRLPSRAIS